MKKIADQKLQAFSIGSMGMRTLSRKELKEQKKKEEEEAAAHVFQEFVETFQEAPCKTSKVWIKAGTYNPGARKEDTTDRGKLYKPQSRMESNEKSSAERAQEYVRLLASKPDPKPSKKKDKDKKKSNLELFKEELRQIQEEREERHKYKGALKNAVSDSEILPPFCKDEMIGSFDYGDPNTTNLYLGNLSPKLTEQQLMEIFGRYGPLASIKIMWPRSEEEKARGRNCGFVAYMSRKDGERALRNLNGKEIMQCEMKMGWGKAVVIPPHPIYIPPSMLSPPPPSGLPFNAQPPRQLINKIPRLRPGEAFPTEPEDKEALNKILSQSIVKVVIPKERQSLMLIHRMVEFVIREGPMFEAMIMNKELTNPQFRFLFENQSQNHVYYRWKLFSLLQGDSPKEWNTKEFKMFKSGSIWRPPGMNVYTQGMPDDLIEEDEVKDTKGTLSKTQRERLEDLIRQLTPERWKVGEAMVFCIEHADAADEIADCLAESLSSISTATHKKAARLYLLSDVLHNCGSKMSSVTHFRKAFESRLVQIMLDVFAATSQQEDPLLSEGLRMRVGNILRAWNDWNVYPRDFIMRLHSALNGIELKEPEPEQMDENEDQSGNISGSGEGEPDDEGEEGGPLDGAALLKAAQGLNLKGAITSTPKQTSVVDDIDGIPLDDDDIDGIPLDEQGDKGGLAGSLQVPGFIPSRWESVDGPVEGVPGWGGPARGVLVAEDSEEERPVRTPPPPPAPHIRSPSPPDNNDLSEVTDERRQILRAVELRAMQYQDELEASLRQLRPGWTLQQQVQHYRRKLIKKAEREAKEKEEVADSPERIIEKKSYKDKDREKDRERDSRGGRSGSSEDGYITSNSSTRKSKRSRDISLSPPQKRSRHRSRSPPRKSRQTSSRRSPSPPSPPVLSYHSSRRSDTSSSSSSRKHKHKHKY